MRRHNKAVLCEVCGSLPIAEDDPARCQPTFETRRRIVKRHHENKTGHEVLLFPEDIPEDTAEWE